MAGIVKQWHVASGQQIILPQGAELMQQGIGHEIWYSPHLDHSYYIVGSNVAGWDITEYDQPLCSRCQERRAEYREGRR